MNPEHEQNGPHSPDAFTKAHETADDLMRQIAEANGLNLDAQNQPRRDGPELITQVRQARMEINNASEDTVVLLMASETARDLSDQKLADGVYVSLAEAYGKRGNIAGGLEAANQIKDYLSRLEGLARLSYVSKDQSAKDQLNEAAKNEAGEDFDINKAQEIYHKFRIYDGDLFEGDTFAAAVATAAEKAPSYDKNTDAWELKQAIKLNPQSPEPSLQARARTLVHKARARAVGASPNDGNVGLNYLDQYYTKAQAEEPGPDKDKMLAAHAIATVELADFQRHGKAAA